MYEAFHKNHQTDDHSIKDVNLCDDPFRTLHFSTFFEFCLFVDSFFFVVSSSLSLAAAVHLMQFILELNDRFTTIKKEE